MTLSLTIGILGQVWCLIVSIHDLNPLFYFHKMNICVCVCVCGGGVWVCFFWGGGGITTLNCFFMSFYDLLKVKCFCICMIFFFFFLVGGGG